MTSNRSGVSVAHQLIRTLVAHDVRTIFLNPGTDTAPFQEALAALAAGGEPVPRVVLCLHEGVALAAAHGYFALTGRPQVVMVHVDVGTQNLGSHLHNVARAEAGVVIIAGRTPFSAHGELPGGRDSAVHWMQDVADQAGTVRPYVKWSGDLASAPTAVRVLTRALQVAASAPSGPVYLTAAREILMQDAPATELPARRYGPAVGPAPDPAAIERAAELLAGSARPVVVTARAGRDPDAVAALVAVAGAVGARVVDGHERVNLPSSHPGHLADPGQAAAALRAADVVLVVDAPVPWVPRRAAPPETATVISLEFDPVQASMPGWSFPVDLGIACDPAHGLRALAASLAGRAVASKRWPDLPAPGQPAPVEASSERFAASEVARALNEMLADDDIVLEEATTNSGPLHGGLRRELPGTYFRSGGSALGWVLGAALGAKLAAPDRRVVAISGDGAFVFASPTAALFSLHESGAPVLVVVLCNGGYAASRQPVFTLFPEGESARTRDVVGTLFSSSLDFAALARSCQAYGENVRTLDDLRPALRRALAEVDAGRSAVVGVPVTSPWM